MLAPFLRPERNEVAGGDWPLAISFAVAADGEANVSVYDSAGEKILDLWRGKARAHHVYAAAWEGRNDRGSAVTSNVYVVRLTAPRLRLWKKVAVRR